MSDFGRPRQGWVWACRTVELPQVDGGSGHKESVHSEDGTKRRNQVTARWVLVVNVNPGASPAARAPYFRPVDGKQFTRRTSLTPRASGREQFPKWPSGSTTLRAGNGPPPGFVGKASQRESTGSEPGNRLSWQNRLWTRLNGSLEGTITSPSLPVNSKYINCGSAAEHPTDPNATDAPMPAGVCSFSAPTSAHCSAPPPYETARVGCNGGMVNQTWPRVTIGGQQQYLDSRG